MIRPVSLHIALLSFVSLWWTSSMRGAEPSADTPLGPGLNITYGQRNELAALNAQLQRQTSAWRADHSGERELGDIEFVIDAISRAGRFQEYGHKKAAENLQRAAQVASQRITALQSGAVPWAMSPGKHVIAYRSAIDQTAQPYAVTLPQDFTVSGSHRWPLYVVLHGRSDGLTEANFLAQHHGKPAPETQTWIQIDVFGRGNNAYRWAGETDVLEAIHDAVRRYRIDERRVVLWGFSMGGAGAWHLGLHHPAKWCSVGAGAGFVDFYKYQKVESPLPEFQDRTLSIYDATHYATNLLNVPLITYGGENDPQLAASTTMRDLAATEKAPLQVLIGPNMGHAFDPESLAKFMAFHQARAENGRREEYDRRTMRFSTYTVKYNECDWLRIEEQIIPYEESAVSSSVDDNGVLLIDTENVEALSLSRTVAERVSIDGSIEFPLTEAAEGRLPQVYFVRSGDSWQLLSYDDSLAFDDPDEPRKRRHLQGPIDDAFMQSFVCVRGTGTPWSAAHQAYTEFCLRRFEREFDQWMRGRVQVVADTDVTKEMIANHHLILFGDPGSNSLIAQVLDGLPLEWDEESITWNGSRYNPDLHAVPLIYPNPLHPRKYVVLNSGHTFHEPQFKASNAQLYPRLGDAAVIRFRPNQNTDFREEIVSGLIFSSRWAIEE
ncbi:MAG: hypothetical protein DWH91_12090 [Planctomycetota bacterium]|nr:MAG: hypothetical protein DWH91_12090 [Planctomycetota bacterium]